MMEITMIGTLPPIKGVSDYCIEQTRELRKKVRVKFYNFSAIYPEFLYKGGGTKETDPVFTAGGSSNLSVHSTLAWYNPFSWIAAGLGAEGKIVHFHWWTFYLFPVFFTSIGIARMRSKKIVCTVHNVLSHETGAVDKILSGIIFFISDKLIVHTRNNREQLIAHFKTKPEKIEVIPHGIYEFYRDKEISKKGARKKLSIPAGAKVMLFFGNIRRYKGLEDLIAAFRQSQQEVKGLYLLIAGKPWGKGLEAEVRGSLSGVSRKKLSLGYIPSSEIKNYFSAADVVVLPYKDFAGQSGPGNIALAFEKPLIVSNAGGLPELVLNKGVIFDAGGAGALARKITLVFSRKGMLASLSADSARLRRKYSWANICRATLNIYNKLAA